MTSLFKELTVEEIPDITSDMLDKLRKLNIKSVYQLAVQIPSELAFEPNDISVDVESAAKLIGNARKILTESEILSKEFLTADDMLEKRTNVSRYSTGSSNFDTFLNGGIESQSITEIAGEFAEAIRLNVSGVIAGRGDNIQYVYTDSNHTEPLYRITPAKLISSKDYDKEKYLEMLLILRV
jgi:DNA repair protein RadA